MSTIAARRGQAGTVIVAVGRYDHWDPLDTASDAARKLAEKLDRRRFQLEHAELLDGGPSGTLKTTLKGWFLGAKHDDKLVLFWTGHGHRDGARNYLVTQDSPRHDLTAFDAVYTGDLGDLIGKSKAEKILILLDTCYSGAGADDLVDAVAQVLANRAPVAGREKAVAVIASAHPLEKAQEGLFCDVLRELLTEPAAGRRWSDEDEYIHTDKLASAVAAELERRGFPQRPRYKADGHGQEFVPNPRFQAGLPPEDVETRRRRLERAAADHFVPASRGIEVGEAGWYFTGRRRLMAELVSWLREPQPGMLIVTGPPGAGKSAVLGRLATLSDERYRELAGREESLESLPLETVPPEGSIDVAVHAKGKTFDDCVEAIVRGLEIQDSERTQSLESGPQTPDVVQVLEHIRSLGSVAVLLDALDEAKPGHSRTIASRLLLPLSRLPNVRLVVGTRRHPEGKIVPEGLDRHTELSSLFGDSARIIDLADEPETLEDIAEYVRRRLRDSRHRDDAEAIERAAQSVAEKSDGVFLYARLVARTLIDAESLAEDLPATALEAFVSDLRRRFGERETLVDDLLRALAWGEGRGFTRAVWAPVATALSHAGAEYGDGEVAWVLANAGWHIVEAGEAGQAVYRLAHQLFADHYRGQGDFREVNAQITRTLSEGIEGAAWLDADRYLWRHLATHAANAGVLDGLVQDPGFLAVADPAGLLPALKTVHQPQVLWISDVYRRTADRVSVANPIERMPLIHLTACQEEPEKSSSLKPPVAGAWKCLWSAGRRTSPHTVLGRHHSRVNSVAWGEIDGRLVLASAGDDGTVRLWDPAAARPIGEPLRGHAGGVLSVAWGEIDGRPVLASAGRDGSLCLWDPARGSLRGESFRGHEPTSIAWGQIDGQPVLASAGLDKTVQLWDPATRRPRGEPLRGHDGWVRSLAWGFIDDLPVLASAGHDHVVRLWDPAAGRPIGEPLRGHAGGVTSLAWGRMDGQLILGSAGFDGTVRLWDPAAGHSKGDPLRHEASVHSLAWGQIDGRPVLASGEGHGVVRLWDPATGRPLSDPLRGHAGPVRSLGWGQVDCRPVLASAGDDGTVRLWDPAAGHDLSDAYHGHDGEVRSAALKQIDGRAVLASGGGDGAVRLWNPADGRLLTNPLRGHDGSVRSLALERIDGRPFLASAGDDGTVRLWDLTSGRPRGDPLRGHDRGVNSVAWGKVDSRPVLASAGDDGTVRLWDFAAGRPLGEPLCCHDGGASSVAWGRIHGQLVLGSGGFDGAVRLWDPAAQRPLSGPLLGHDGAVSSLTWGRLGGRPFLASTGGGGAVRLWDPAAARPLGRTLFGHNGWANSATWAEIDGRSVLASAGDDGTVRLWDLDTGENRMVIQLGVGALFEVSLHRNLIAIAASRGVVAIELNPALFAGN